jgi:hypothetical protein
LGNEIEQTDSKCIRLRVNMWSGYEISTNLWKVLFGIHDAGSIFSSFIDRGWAVLCTQQKASPVASASVWASRKLSRFCSFRCG